MLRPALGRPLALSAAPDDIHAWPKVFDSAAAMIFDEQHYLSTLPKT
jgi:hypothetical protein